MSVFVFDDILLPAFAPVPIFQKAALVGRNQMYSRGGNLEKTEFFFVCFCFLSQSCNMGRGGVLGTERALCKRKSNYSEQEIYPGEVFVILGSFSSLAGASQCG
jgi:hypothetical protein